MKEKIYTVRQATRLIKNLVEQGIDFLWVKGEISNFKAHSSGHFYFSLKDEFSQLSCVMFREDNKKILFKPENGMEILANGRIGVYEKQGVYQLYVYDMKPVGMGELALKFEALKKKLKAEGLFAESHKQPLPAFPLKIGVATASTGAAIQDILNILTRRAPYVQVIIHPVKVQGKGAAEEVAAAIKDFNEYKDIDLLIIGRGGGSVEDLWAFNEEVLARAIYDSKIPIISAVGHEIDFTISDFTADLRAPTPSAAAELAVKDGEEITEGINRSLQIIKKSLISNLENKYEKLGNLVKRYGIARVKDMVRERKQTIDEYSRRLSSHMSNFFSMNNQITESLIKRIMGLNPEAVKKRGYAIIRKLPNENVVTGVEYINLYDRLKLEFADGNLRVIVDKKMKNKKEGVK